MKIYKGFVITKIEKYRQTKGNTLATKYKTFKYSCRIKHFGKGVYMDMKFFTIKDCKDRIDQCLDLYNVKDASEIK